VPNTIEPGLEGVAERSEAGGGRDLRVGVSFPGQPRGEGVRGDPVGALDEGFFAVYAK
jgi:hypothetical protein